MPRGISIHVGVNHAATMRGRPLTTCEATAWRMAEVAARAGYGEIHLLRGAAATREALLAALDGAAGALREGDTLFLSFAGHGRRVPDLDGDERDGSDETWCLHDGDVLDDALAERWRRMAPGVRAVVVAESCFGGGIARGVDEFPARPPAPAGGVPAGPVMRGGVQQTAYDAAPCISRMPENDHGIRASVLLLAACAKREVAREGLYTWHLLDAWSNGAFGGSFCALHRRIARGVMCENGAQTPQILMLGAPDPGFPEAPAFHLPVRRAGYRGGG